MMKTSFALAILAYVKPSYALTLEAQSYSDVGPCVLMGVIGEMRPQADITQAMDFQWREGIKRFSPTDFIYDGELIMRQCNDNTIRTLDNKCLTHVADLDDATIIADCTLGNISQQFITQAAQSSCDDGQGNLAYCSRVASQATFKELGPDGYANAEPGDGNLFLWKDHFGDSVSARIQNVGTKLCLQPVENLDQALVSSVECSEDENQNFTIWESGQIIHDASGLCFGQLENPTTPMMNLNYCNSKMSQAWNTSDKAEYMLIYDRDNAGEYLVSNISGSQTTKDTTTESAVTDYHKWRSIGSGEWTQPKFEWISVGCDLGADLTHIYTQSMYIIDANDQQQEVSDDNVNSLEQNFADWNKVSNNVPVDSSAASALYESLSEMIWHPSDAYVDKQHAFNCGEFEDGTLAQTGGCLWRSLMTSHNWQDNEDLYWHTPLTKCTVAGQPICPPMTKCGDEYCTQCVQSGYVNPEE